MKPAIEIFGDENILIAMDYWWRSAKLYELYIDKFAGTIPTLTDRLDYFNTLGVNCLHILPHYPSPMIDEGYDVSDYRNVREDLGTVEDFERLLLAAHRKGIRVIVDLVLNHTSDQHPWFIEARSSKHNQRRDYYLWSDTGNELAEAENVFPMIKQRNWIKNAQTDDYYFATFYPAQPDLNWDNPTVFDEMLGIMEYWAEKGVDGFRIDAAAHIIKREGTRSKDLPETHATLRKIRAALQKKYPNVVLLAEASATSRDYFGQGDECHMVYHFPLMREMWTALMTGDSRKLEQMKEDAKNIPENCQWATFLRNHDDISLSTLGDDEVQTLVKFLDPQKKYMFGDYPAVRVAEIFDGDTEKIVAAHTMLLGCPGAPILYYGDEIGMRNLPPAQGVHDARVYVRGDFDWITAKKQIQDPTSIFNRVAAALHGPLVPREPKIEPTAI